MPILDMKRKTFTIVLFSFFSVTPIFAAPSKGGTYIDPANVDADYAVQGEYSGTIDGGKAGGHLIALGDGTDKERFICAEIVAHPIPHMGKHGKVRLTVPTKVCVVIPPG